MAREIKKVPAPSYEELVERVRFLEDKVATYEQELERSTWTQRHSRELFESLLYEVHVWQLIRNDDGEIISWRLLDANPAALNIWEMELDDIVGKQADEIFMNADATKTFLPIVNKIFSDGEPYLWEQYFSGTDQTLHMVSIALSDDVFISSGMDVSNLKNAEQKLQETVLQLTEAITAANVGLWTWDLTTKKPTFSREWKAQIGYAEDEIADEFEEWHSRVHPDDVERTMADINRTISTASKYHESEFRLRHKNGSYRWIFVHASTILDDDGNIARMVGCHIDITDRKKLQQELLQTKKMEAMGTLAGGIAHDFNNLLGPILGYSQLVKLGVAPGTQDFDYLTQIETAAKRAKSLVEKILMVSRGSSPHNEAVSLKKTVEEVVGVLRGDISDEMSIECRLSVGLLPVSADSSKIYQLILNLCTNAIQAMQDGGTMTITLDSAKQIPTRLSGMVKSAPYGYVHLAIEDTGTGMEPSVVEQMFDPFYTTKQKNTEKGSGLGLAIVASAIRDLDGYVHVDSWPGKGTRFDVYLPASEVPQKSSDGKKLLNYRSPNKESVMLVDDEKMACEMANAALMELGYKVSSFNDALTAVEAFKNNANNFDVIISDYAMEDVDGEQFFKLARKIRSDIPFIIVTGYAKGANVQSLSQLGCDQVIEKPFSIEKLGLAVRAALESKSKSVMQ